MRAITHHTKNMNEKDTGSPNKPHNINVVARLVEDYFIYLMPLDILRIMTGETNEILQAEATSKKKVMARKDWPKFELA